MRVLVLLIGILGFFVQITAQTIPQSCTRQHCVAVIDAGSTGSRLHVYSYDLDSNQSVINITERWARRINPGIASLEARKERVDAYLDDLFPDLVEQKIPVYFYATAGMRLLSKPRQQKLYNLVQNWFADRRDWQLVQAKTISGSDEGLFGWLAVNYQTGSTDPAKEPVGVLDFGGASVQVSFPVTNKNGIDPDDLREAWINGQHITLFVHSFLGLGQIEVSHQFLNKSACFSTNYELPDGLSAKGDAYACKSDIFTLLKSVHQVDEIVQPAIASSTVKNWYALGGIVSLAKSKPFSFNDQEFTNAQLLEKANTVICQQSWSSLLANFPDDDYLYGYCFFPAYYYALFVDGYGLNPEQKINYLAADQQGDWTMGVVMYLMR